MPRFLVAIPVAADVGEEARKFDEEVRARSEEFSESRRRIGVTRERGWLQRTPDGGQLFLLMLEGDDPVEANRRFAESREPFDVWFKERAGAIFGIDVNQPIPVQPELVYQSVPEDGEAKQSVAVALPLVPGQEEAHRQVAEEVKGPRKEAFDEFHRRAGVLEDWWHQPTPDGTVVLLYLESDDLAGAMGHLAQSQDETETWFKERLLATEGIDWSAPPPPLPEPVFDWRP